MDTNDLSITWKIVSCMLTAVVMLLLGMLGLIIADAVGAQSNSYAYAGFFVGLSSYGLIKAMLLRLTNRNKQGNTSDINFDETISISNTTDKSVSNDAQNTNS